MKSASKILYTIGLVFSYIGLFGCAIILLMGILLTTGVVAAPETSGDAAAVALPVGFTGMTILIIGIIATIIELAVIVCGHKCIKALKNGVTEQWPHILAIVIGAIGGDIFFLIAGITGLIAENENN